MAYLELQIVTNYRVYFENIAINQFSRILEAVRRTSMSVKILSLLEWFYNSFFSKRISF